MTQPHHKIKRGAKHERNARLQALENGPWMVEGRRAWADLALAQLPEGVELNGPAIVDLHRVFEDYEASKQDGLVQVLRPHWERWVQPKHVPVRDSLDEALSEFQLYELAVETGYIDLDDVKEAARTRLARLLWSEAARRYVREYDYVAVGFLATRLGLGIGYGELEPPEVIKKDEGRFALFVSQHRAWYEEEVEAWLSFLDDYWVVGDDESDKEIFYSFLRSRKKEFDDEEVLLSFVSGADRFLTLLSDLYSTLTESERPRYGLFYAYWMARFFGWDSKKSGFFRDDEQTDWSKELLRSRRLETHFNEFGHASGVMPANGKLGLWEQYKSTLEERVDNVREFWNTTRGFLEEHAYHEGS